MAKRKIKIGFDFDGVIAYNPFRIIRAPWAYIKHNILGVKKLSFFYPEKQWQKIIWKIMHDSSIIPSKGVKLLRELNKESIFEAHLITGRYKYLDNHLDSWLTKFDLKKIFSTININAYDEQPHLFKEKMITKLGLDYFIEDNLDIVRHLHQKGKTRIFWIYNIVDRSYPHPHKFPYLEEALKQIFREVKRKKEKKHK